ncbi:hypothetical protein [Acidithiobacillus sp.]|uniref:hypothetical protein n=1 Tax=Acidithiobacillus sp. TaxID=1872118 RepID=UPI00262B9852|nr:hypothetical protein [Acidithiobacillus sp.]MDD5278712.1 hypothetical protein [Acidithiobacillus sp.]
MFSKKVQKTLSIAVLAAIGVAFPADQVYAATLGMNWSEQKTFTPSDSTSEIFKNLQDGHIFVGSNMGAAVAAIRLSSSQVKALTGAGQTFNMPWNTPVVFATYDPGTTSGTIFVTRMIKQPGGAGIIELAQFSPSMGAVFTKDFENTNPFWQFVPNQNGNGSSPDPGAFVSITQSAFNAAVGLVMQHVNSDIGWIASDNNNAHMSTSSSSNIITSTTTHKETVMTNPVWTAVVPQGSAPGTDYGYLLPVPETASSTESGAIAMESADTNGHTIGGLTSSTAQFGDDYYGQLEVNGGYAYIPQGQGATLPVGAFESFFHSTKHTGFMGWVMDLILAVITVVTFGAGAVLMGMYISLTMAAEAMAVGFVTGMIYDVATKGSLGVASMQEHLVGGNCGKHNGACVSAPAVNMSAAYNSAQNYDGYGEGYINVDTNPTQSTGQWDYEPAAAAATEVNPNQQQAGFGQGYQGTRIHSADAQKGEDLQQMAGQAQKNASGEAEFGAGPSANVATQSAPQ